MSRRNRPLLVTVSGDPKSDPQLWVLYQHRCSEGVDWGRVAVGMLGTVGPELGAAWQ